MTTVATQTDIYRAWHERLGHREFRITISMQGYGRDEDAAEAFLEGFLEKHPEVGPVIGQNLADDTISVTFSLRASDEEHAFSLGRVIFIDGGAASGLPPGDVTRVEVEPVQVASGSEQLQPA